MRGIGTTMTAMRASLQGSAQNPNSVYNNKILTR
jgi:hypothetical protein